MINDSEKSERDAVKEIIYNRAPDNDARDLVRKQLHQASLKQIVSVLWDGLAYGNWPWMSFKVSDILA